LPRGGDLGHYELQGDSSLATGQWYHVAMVSTGSLVTLYINGNEDVSEAITVQQVDSQRAVRIGLEERFYGTLNYFNGIIDEVRIYKRALSPSEIHALYNASLVGEATDPVGDAPPYRGLTSPDLVSATGMVIGSDLVLNVQFYAGTFVPATSCAQFNFDTDQDSTLDYYLNLEPFYSSPPKARLYKAAGNILVDSFNLTIRTNGMETTIPLSKLSDDGRMNFFVYSYFYLTEFGGPPYYYSTIRDTMPDTGVVTIE